jgi:uncharacterized protein (DUF58 family)
VAGGPGRDERARWLFEPDFLRRLERLELLARKLFRGSVRGEHTTERRGRGLEFRDFRRYRPGDDLRYIDWNIYSRLDRLFLKLFASEEDLTLHIVLDTSASMGFGQPSKFDYGRRLAAALAYVGLNNLDRVGIGAFAAGAGPNLAPCKSRSQITTVLGFLSDLECAGRTEFAEGLARQAERMRSPGLAIVISDLLGGSDLRDGLEALRHRGHDVVAVQVLAEEEIEPPLDGALRLVDAEDGTVVQATVDARLRHRYREHLQAELASLERYAHRTGIEYLRASTAIPFDDLVLRYLRHGRHWR